MTSIIMDSDVQWSVHIQKELRSNLYGIITSIFCDRDIVRHYYISLVPGIIGVDVYLVVISPWLWFWVFEVEGRGFSMCREPFRSRTWDSLGCGWILEILLTWSEHWVGGYLCCSASLYGYLKYFQSPLFHPLNQLFLLDANKSLCRFENPPDFWNFTLPLVLYLHTISVTPTPMIYLRKPQLRLYPTSEHSGSARLWHTSSPFWNDRSSTCSEIDLLPPMIYVILLACLPATHTNLMVRFPGPHKSAPGQSFVRMKLQWFTPEHLKNKPHTFPSY